MHCYNPEPELEQPSFQQQQPYAHQFPQQSFPHQFVPQSSALRFQQQLPYAFNLPQQSFALQIPQQPSGLQIPHQPSGLQFPQQPSAVQIHQQPSALQLQQQPSTLQFPQQPSALQLQQQPSTLQFPQQPSTLQFPQQPQAPQQSNKRKWWSSDEKPRRPRTPVDVNRFRRNNGCINFKTPEGCLTPLVVTFSWEGESWQENKDWILVPQLFLQVQRQGVFCPIPSTCLLRFYWRSYLQLQRRQKNSANVYKPFVPHKTVHCCRTLHIGTMKQEKLVSLIFVQATKATRTTTLKTIHSASTGMVI